SSLDVSFSSPTTVDKEPFNNVSNKITLYLRYMVERNSHKIALLGQIGGKIILKRLTLSDKP
ncbi:MAG: hypothetical protein ACTIHG_08570, partial [Streptococcus thermophilus]